MRIIRRLLGGEKPPEVPRARSAGKARKRVRNHASLSSPRQVPEDFLRRLRRIDETFDLHYVGNGHWILGAVRPNRVRTEIAGKMHLARDRRYERHSGRSFARLALPWLGMQGFAPVAYYHIQGEPDYRIIADARERDWRYRTAADSTFAERLDDSEGMHDLRGSERSMKNDKWWDELEYREKHERPRLFRGRTHFAQGALHR